MVGLVVVLVVSFLLINNNNSGGGAGIPGTATGKVAKSDMAIPVNTSAVAASTSTLIPTPLPSATSAATDTPTPVPTPTETQAPTPTPAPSDTPTLTPAPTHTAAPTRTPGPTATPRPAGNLYPAPVQVSPASGSKFVLPDTPTLSWTSVGNLGPNDYYFVQIDHSQGVDPYYVQGTSVVPRDYLPTLQPANGFTWRVSVVRKTASGYTAVSPVSGNWVFYWSSQSGGGGGGGSSGGGAKATWTPRP